MELDQSLLHIPSFEPRTTTTLDPNEQSFLRTLSSRDPESVLEALRDPSLSMVEMPEGPFYLAEWAEFVREVTVGDSPVYFSKTGSIPTLMEHTEQVLSSTLAGYRAPKQLRPYLDELSGKLHLVSELSGSDQLNLVMRNHFWAPDLIWHFDRLPEGDFPEAEAGVRLNWSPGRPVGMRTTHPSNIDQDAFLTLFQRNEPFLRALYGYAERQGQVAASELVLSFERFHDLLQSQADLLLFDPTLVDRADPTSSTLHKIGGEKTFGKGSPHCLCIENREQPGHQAIISAPLSSAA